MNIQWRTDSEGYPLIIDFYINNVLIADYQEDNNWCALNLIDGNDEHLLYESNWVIPLHNTYYGEPEKYDELYEYVEKGLKAALDDGVVIAENIIEKIAKKIIDEEVDEK
jgi:hypothetical protein